ILDRVSPRVDGIVELLRDLLVALPRLGVNGQVRLHHDRHRTLTGRRRHQTVRHRRTRRTHHPKRTALVINLHVNTTAGDIPAGGCAKPQRGPEHLDLSPRLWLLLVGDEDTDHGPPGRRRHALHAPSHLCPRRPTRTVQHRRPRQTTCHQSITPTSYRAAPSAAVNGKSTPVKIPVSSTPSLVRTVTASSTSSRQSGAASTGNVRSLIWLAASSCHAIDCA